MTDELQKPHQGEKRVPCDPPRAKRAMKLETGISLNNGVGSGRHAKLDVAVGGPDPDQRIKKRVSADDVPVRLMFLNQLHLGKARIQIRLRTLDLDPGGRPYNPAHPAML